MPKRVGCLYERMLDLELIRTIIVTGSKGKRHRRDVRFNPGAWAGDGRDGRKQVKHGTLNLVTA